MPVSRHNKGLALRTGMLVQNKFVETQGPQEVTSVWWTPTGDIIYLSKDGQEVGPFFANLFRPVPRRRM